MTKNSYLKLEIRARMELTGESYSAASRAIAQNKPLPPASTKLKDRLELEELQLYRQVPLRDQIVFIDRLGHFRSLTRAADALEAVIDQVDNEDLKIAIEAALQDLREDPSLGLSGAFAPYPHAFHPFLVKSLRLSLDGSSFKSVSETLKKEQDIDARLGVKKPEFTLDHRTLDSLDGRSIAIFVGPQAEGDRLAQIRPEWQFLPYFSSAVELKNAFMRREFDILESPIRAIIYSDTVTAGGSGGDAYAFHSVVQARAADNLVAVISYSPSIARGIEEWLKIDRKERAGAGSVFFIDPRFPSRSLDKALEGFDRMVEDLETAKKERIKPISKSKAPIFNWDDRDPRPTAAFIGPIQVAESLAKIKPEWKFIHSMGISDFFGGLATGTITQDICAVLVVDKFWDPSRKSTELESLASNLSPYCLFGVVSYEEKLQEPILESIRDKQRRNRTPRGEIYFVDAKRPASSLELAIEAFLEDAPSEADDAISQLKQNLAGSWTLVED